jgi:hypothetical protein
MMNRLFAGFLISGLLLADGSFFLWLQQALANYRVL